MSEEIVQGSDAWKQQRLGKLTASRLADALARTKTGYSTSRQNLLMELAIQRITGVVEEGFKSDAMTRGNEEEPFARIAYEAKTGNFVDQVSFIDHPALEWAGMSPDGLIDKVGLVEIKNPNSATHWATLRAQEIPSKYIIQMNWQLACTDREWNDFVSFDRRMPENCQLFIKRLYRDDKVIRDLELEAAKFLDEVAEEVERMKKYGAD